jgi:hypothetical protein
MIQRRLYLYIVGAASLGMLAVGLANLGTTTLDLLLRPGAIASTYRDAYAGFGAVTLVGLPVWVTHWGIAQRLALRNPQERASAIRRLYLYAAAAALMITAAIFVHTFLEDLIGAAAGLPLDGTRVLRAVWVTALSLGFWFYHFRAAAMDRAAVGEAGASATLRRWYAYGILLFGLALLLFGARNLVQQLWTLVVQPQVGEFVGPGGTIASALATMLAGAGVFAFHWWWTSSGAIAEDDRQSTLRAVQGFLALAVSVGMALFGGSQLLYYGLARALGVQSPGGVVAPNLLEAMASPGATLVVFGLAWIWLRRQLAEDARKTEATRQAGVRRLYTHLVALFSIGALAVGAAGLLWTLSDQVLNSLLGRPIPEWRDHASAFVTLAIVGTPMWLTHWRPAPDAVERHTLSRRLYLYAALLGSVLAILVSGATLIYRLLAIVLAATGSDSSAAVVDIGRAASVIIVAAGLGWYHWRIVRTDAGVRPVAPAEPVSAPPRFTVEIQGASEEEIRRALGGLPGEARVSIQRETREPTFE